MDTPPPAYEQATVAARDDIDRTELTNLVYDLPDTAEVMVDFEDEPRPTRITVGFDPDGRGTHYVAQIMRQQGWRFEDVTWSPYNRLSWLAPADTEQ